MSKRSDELYLRDIVDSIIAIEDFTKGLMFEQFREDRKTFSATIREFEVIGEGVGKLSDDIKEKYPNSLYQDIKDFRNKLIHEYFGIDAEIVWNTIVEDLPEFKRLVLNILKNEYPVEH